MNDDITNVNVISLFCESGNYRGLCWPGPVLFIILGLSVSGRISRPRPSFMRQLMTSHSVTRVICVCWTH